MLRFCPALAALLLVLLTTACGRSSVPDVGSAASANYAWKGQGSGVFREAQYDQGEWIYTNGIWQARGANADGLHRTDYFAVLMPLPIDPTYITRDLYNAMTYDFFGVHRATHNGDYTLPLDHTTWPDGTGDLAEVRLAADRQNLYVRFLWNSMPRPDAQIATLTFATTSGGASTVAPWPRNAKVSSAWQSALTVWGTGATLQTADGHEITVPASVGDHITQVQIPLSQLPSAPWTLNGGSGLDDPRQTGHYWDVSPGLATKNATGSGALGVPTNVWDLLFAQDTPWTFDERRQADDLAAGDVSADLAQVDLVKLQSGQTELAPLHTGDFSRMFASQLFEADGITRSSQGGLPVPLPSSVTLPVGAPDLNVSYFYTGRLQTYSMHVPASYSATSTAYPLIVYLHGFTGLPDEPFYCPVGLVQMADQNGYLFASLLGRGDYTYLGEGDFDVLEAIADVSQRYHVDPDRIYLMGHSMGGYGTNNVGMRHPDLFAAMAPAEGTDSADLYANLRDLPWFEITAAEDLDLLAQSSNALYSSLSTAGYDATLLEYLLKTHEYSSIYDTLPRLFRFFAAHKRNINPAVVSYTRIPNEDYVNLGLIYDGAYWLSGLRAADTTKTANVTLESDGIQHVIPDPATAVRTDQTVDEGGPSGRTLAELKQTVPNTAPVSVIGNTLHITATNAGTMMVALKRASLTVDGAALAISSVVDAPLLLNLADVTSPSVTVSIDNVPAPALVANAGVVAVQVPAGTHHLTLAGQ